MKLILFGFCTLLFSLCVVAQTTTCQNPSGYKAGTTPWNLATSGVVTIASGQNILLDRSLTLTELRIEGKLVFDLLAINLTASWIEISNGGSLWIGSSTCYFTAKAIITLVGTRQSNAADIPGNNFLYVHNGGQIYLYGAHDPLPYTKLSQTAVPGSNEIRTVNQMTWKVGDTIVVAPTDYNVERDEVFVIAQVVNSQRFILNTTFKDMHWGQSDPYIDERAEVALLTRNIVIRGSLSADNDKFGGHFMMDATFGRAHIEGVEFSRMGQGGILGKYPIHFHMAHNVSNIGAVVHNSVHTSFQRCVVIHATSGLLVKDNFCHRSVGHAIFLEDGIETDNVIDNNIVINVRPGNLIPSDPQPTGFWITHPANFIRNNRVAGSASHCFWFALPEHPMGPSAAGNGHIWNRRIPLKEFKGNVAHSCNGDGLHVDRGPDNAGFLGAGTYAPRVQPTNSSSAHQLAVFENFTAYKCRSRGVWFRGGLLELKNALFADNAIGCTFAHGGGAHQILNGAHIIGETLNIGSPASWETKGLYGRSLPRWGSPFPLRGIEFYDGPVIFKDAVFRNFIPDHIRGAGAVSNLHRNQFSIMTTNRASNLTFQNSVANRIYYPEVWNDGDKNQVFFDATGSISGSVSYIVTDIPFYRLPGCVERSSWKAAVCPYPDYRFARLSVDSLVGTSTNTYRRNANNVPLIGLTLTRDESPYPQQILWGDSVDDVIRVRWGASIAVNRRYILGFSHPTPPDLRLTLQYATQNDWVIVGIRYPPGTNFGASTAVIQFNWWGDHRTSSVASLAALEQSQSQTWFWDSTRSIFWFKLIHTAARSPDDYSGSNSVTLRVAPVFGSNNMANCPARLPEFFPVYPNNEKCLNSESVENACPGFPYCSGHGFCSSGASSCTCDSGWTGNACQRENCAVLYPTCSGHGTCQSSGLCTCQSGYHGHDCSKVNSCPGGCGQGSCVESQCVCNTGYTGSDCRTKVIIPSGASWKHLFPTSATACCPQYPFTVTFPTAITFNATNYNDGSWPTASAPFYLGTTVPSNRGPGTPLPNNCNVWNCDPNYYFRRTFQISNEDYNSMTTIALRIASDDGADIYINGVLVDSDREEHDFKYWNRELSLPKERFVAGTNLIAVFLSNPFWSNDAYFDMELTIRPDDVCQSVSCGANSRCILGRCLCYDGYAPNSDGVCTLLPGRTCVPNCSGRTCGNDGCGGSCGSCGQGQACTGAGSCICQRDCNGKTCGSDGCGGSCGGCSSPNVCVSGLCECVGNCTGRQCGSNGCGGSCGSCAGGTPFCSSGTCISNCVPNCSGKNCGDDGCGGSCGSCSSSQHCSSGVCVCNPNCSGKQCGDNGCGGQCNSCPTDYFCTSEFVCDVSCVPSCSGKSCGNNGCGGSCGSCSNGLSCLNFQCVAANLCANSNCTIADPNAVCNPANGRCDCRDDFILVNGVCSAVLQDKCRNVICSDNNKNCDQTQGTCTCITAYADNSSTSCLPCENGRTVTCNVLHGTGTKTCSNGVFGACSAQSCEANHRLEFGRCVPIFCTPGEVHNCQLDGGSGVRSCPSSGIFSSCNAINCEEGFALSDGVCESESLSEGADSGFFALDNYGFIGAVAAVALALILVIVVSIVVYRRKKSANGWY